MAKTRKTQGNTGNFVRSSCKFPDSKDEQYCDSCSENFKICFRSYQVSFGYVMVTNHVNLHWETLRSDRENTGNLKMQSEWGPCVEFGSLPQENNTSVLSPAQTLQVIYLRLDVRIACDGLQQKFQLAEYFTCNPLISQPMFIQCSSKTVFTINLGFS